MDEEQIRADERQAIALWLHDRADGYLRTNRRSFNTDPDSPANTERVHYAHEDRELAYHLAAVTTTPGVHAGMPSAIGRVMVARNELRIALIDAHGGGDVDQAYEWLTGKARGGS